MVKHPYKVHAWSVFSVKGPISFFLFTDIMDGALYRKILTENLFENANKIMGKNWSFNKITTLSTQLKKQRSFLHSSVQNCYTGPQTAQISTRLRIYGKF